MVAISIWIVIHSVVMFCIVGSAAEIETLNIRWVNVILSESTLTHFIRISSALGKMNTASQFSDPKTIAEYKLAFSRLETVPFGIPYFGTRKRISYEEMWTISSVFVSVFLFMLGYV